MMTIWVGGEQAKAKADSFAALRNDKQKVRNGNGVVAGRRFTIPPILTPLSKLNGDPRFATARRMGHPWICGWVGGEQAKAKADSFAALRNDKQKDRRQRGADAELL
jgi:hypothetical protein